MLGVINNRAETVQYDLFIYFIPGSNLDLGTVITKTIDTSIWQFFKFNLVDPNIIVITITLNGTDNVDLFIQKDVPPSISVIDGYINVTASVQKFTGYSILTYALGSIDVGQYYIGLINIGTSQATYILNIVDPQIKQSSSHTEHSSHTKPTHIALGVYIGVATGIVAIFIIIGGGYYLFTRKLARAPKLTTDIFKLKEVKQPLLNSDMDVEITNLKEN